jgi:hypothetical protein
MTRTAISSAPRGREGIGASDYSLSPYALLLYASIICADQGIMVPHIPMHGSCWHRQGGRPAPKSFIAVGPWCVPLLHRDRRGHGRALRCHLCSPQCHPKEKPRRGSAPCKYRTRKQNQARRAPPSCALRAANEGGIWTAPRFDRTGSIAR